MRPVEHESDQRYAATKQQFQEVGYFCRGTVLRRLMPCGKPGCHCQATPPKLHGPYYQWTRKEHGKTITVRLSAHEAQLVRHWIANARRFDAVAARAESLAQKAIARILRDGRQSAG